MTKQEKVEIVEFLKSEFTQSCAIIVCDYKGIKTKQLENLRNNSRALGIKVQVIKNKLAKIALDDAQLPENQLKDTNIFIWGDDQIALSKVVCKFASDHKDQFAPKFGYFDKELVDVKHIEAISKLPSKEELIGMLLSVWTAPARYFVTGLDNLRKQKEEQ
ncbi:50S ribosomal protein L10 [Helicobacter cholecystus]|uniref:Large ribosomal subunit protein uL10 n=1 Tax=Helicobacter cholecystus TaxID=45498 RepID=A0A3D8IUY2_9HELI|nr:50S ribosomal protein L10 [Helicobacter cholecystus]RDU69068.1 50S ribosomal protein L10 [Helicobacter cholecystus]VEJ24601.1 50S ribosomal protein L10 [Helicobacter cholecystus]